MSDSLVSVIVPTYKRCDMLPRAINSVLNQSYQNFEILIVDDNIPGDSYSEGVVNLVKSYGDKRVIYVGQEKHCNGAKARNEGIKASKGEYIAFLDDDDEWLPPKTEEQLNFLEENPNIGGCSCLWKMFRNGEQERQCQPYNNKNLQYKIFSRQVQVMTTSLMVRKNVISKMRGFDINLKRHQDLQFLIDLLAVTNLGVLNEYLCVLHSDSDMNRPNSNQLITIKNEFFDSVQGELSKYTKEEQKRILAAHYFEIVVRAIKEKNLKLAFKYLSEIGLNPKAYWDVINRYKSRT